MRTLRTIYLLRSVPGRKEQEPGFLHFSLYTIDWHSSALGMEDFNWVPTLGIYTPLSLYTIRPSKAIRDAEIAEISGKPALP